MEWILPIAGLIAAIAFLILCVFIGITLMSVKKNLDHVAKTLDGVEVLNHCILNMKHSFWLSS